MSSIPGSRSRLVRALLTISCALMPLSACQTDSSTAINTAGTVATAISQEEIDREYTAFGQLISRVTTARQTGKIKVGSPVALEIAGFIRTAKTALHNNDLPSARAAEAQIEERLP